MIGKYCLLKMSFLSGMGICFTEVNLNLFSFLFVALMKQFFISFKKNFLKANHKNQKILIFHFNFKPPRSVLKLTL
jgi:hypothetical protein